VEQPAPPAKGGGNAAAEAARSSLRHGVTDGGDVAGGSEVSKPEVSKPEVSKPEVSKPKVSKPKAHQWGGDGAELC